MGAPQAREEGVGEEGDQDHQRKKSASEEAQEAGGAAAPAGAPGFMGRGIPPESGIPFASSPFFHERKHPEA